MAKLNTFNKSLTVPAVQQKFDGQRWLYMIFYTTLFHHKCGSKKEYKQQNLTKLLFIFQYQVSTTVMDLVVVFALFRPIFMLALLCFYVAAVFVRWLKIDINSRHLTLNSNPLTLNPKGGSQRTNWTELNKLTQLHDALLVTRVSVTKLIGYSSRTTVQLSSVGHLWNPLTLTGGRCRVGKGGKCRFATAIESRNNGLRRASLKAVIG